MRILFPALAFIGLAAAVAVAPMAMAGSKPPVAAPVTVDYASLPEARAMEAYLNSLSTLRARFIQTDSAGKQVAGTFMLKRPGRMRFEYDAPLRDFIVADGKLIHYYDAKMKQASSALISQSLANFFLRDKLTLSGDIAVSDLRRLDGLLYLTVQQTKDPLGGSLTLVFSEKPTLALLKWRVVEAQGQITEVALYEAEAGIRLKDELFHYYDPSRRLPTYN